MPVARTTEQSSTAAGTPHQRNRNRGDKSGPYRDGSSTQRPISTHSTASKSRAPSGSDGGRDIAVEPERPAIISAWTSRTTKCILDIGGQLFSDGPLGYWIYLFAA